MITIEGGLSLHCDVCHARLLIGTRNLLVKPFDCLKAAASNISYFKRDHENCKPRKNSVVWTGTNV